jgi:sugar transferase (PEP-CTERM/EpsH1 system associated)
MDPILYLVHRIPYPPNKGDKIRSYHWLKFLAERYRVFLGTFVDDPNDWMYLSKLQSLCAEVCVRPLRSSIATPRILRGLVSGRSLSIAYYSDPRLQSWVRDVVARERIDRALVFSSTMGQYLMRLEQCPSWCVVDLVDMDSDKWKQYSTTRRGPMRWIYAREAETLLGEERALAETANRVLLVNSEEAELFRQRLPGVAAKVSWVANGVDSEFFSPATSYSNPFAEGTRTLVFTGAMDYWANVDAVVWFAQEIFPAIRGGVSDARFYIVGSNPSPSVDRLSSIPGVHVTGRVDDVRPYLAHCAGAVAPLRVARGTQNKVLEALAMGKPVIATSAAVQGLVPRGDPELIDVSDDPEKLAALAIGVLGGSRSREAAWRRDYVLSHYDWKRNFDCLGDILEHGDDQYVSRN